MKKVLFILFAGLLVFGLAAASDAAMKKKGRGMRQGMAACDMDCCSGDHMEKLKALGLDDKQMEAVKAVHFKTKKEMIKARADMQVAQIELREMLSKDPVDMKAVEASVRKIEAMKADMKMAHIRAMEEIKSNLTPEQKKKFVSMMADGPMGFGMGMRRGMGMRGCGMHCMDDMDDMGPGGMPDKMPPMKHMHH